MDHHGCHLVRLAGVSLLGVVRLGDVVLPQRHGEVLDVLVLDAMTRSHHVLSVDQNSAALKHNHTLISDGYSITLDTHFRLSYSDQGLPGKCPKARVSAINHPSVCRGPHPALGVVDDPRLAVPVPLRLVVLVEAVIEPVVVEPPVDGDGLDAAHGEEATARAGADPHGEHALEQGLALAPAVTWGLVSGDHHT